MATFNQQDQQVHENQFNADHIDLRDSTFGRLSASSEQEDVLRCLEDVRRAVEHAAANGTLDPQAGRSIADDLRGAAQSLTHDRAEAARRMRKAVGVLQTAAPVAAIGGAMATIWNALGGGS